MKHTIIIIEDPKCQFCGRPSINGDHIECLKRAAERIEKPMTSQDWAKAFKAAKEREGK